MSKKVFATILATSMVVMFFAGCSGGTPSPASQTGTASGDWPTINIKIGHVFAQTHPVQRGLEKYAELVAAQTGGKVTIKSYPSSVLGGDVEMVQQVVEGTLDAVISGGVSPWSGFAPIAEVEEIPFLFPDEKSAQKAYDGPFGDAIKKAVFSPNNAHCINYWENGIRHFTNNTRPIVEPKDMRGIKFRSGLSTLRLAMFESTGSSAVPIAFPELFTALQQKTVDGQENPMTNIESSKFYEVQKYLSISGHIYNASPLVFNQKTWASYPPNVQNVLTKCAEEAKVYQRQMSKEVNDAALDKMKKYGMQVNYVNHDAFVEAMKPVWKVYTSAHGVDLLNLALDSMKKP